jgi:hypothetical protein
VRLRRLRHYWIGALSLHCDVVGEDCANLEVMFDVLIK